MRSPMPTIEHTDRILTQVEACGLRGAALRRLAMGLLGMLTGYDWAGVYRLEDGGLVLDEYVGERTEHTRIAIGQGACGTAVAENRNVTVADVRQIQNYLACSLATRSEIVVLIRDGDTILGQIDVDGHEVNAFDAA